MCLRKWISRHILGVFFFVILPSAEHCLTTESYNREDVLYYTDALHIIGKAEQGHAPDRRHERFHVPPNMWAAGDDGSESQEETCRFIQLG